MADEHRWEDMAPSSWDEDYRQLWVSLQRMQERLWDQRKRRIEAEKQLQEHQRRISENQEVPHAIARMQLEQLREEKRRLEQAAWKHFGQRSRLQEACKRFKRERDQLQEACRQFQKGMDQLGRTLKQSQQEQGHLRAGLAKAPLERHVLAALERAIAGLVLERDRSMETGDYSGDFADGDAQSLRLVLKYLLELQEESWGERTEEKTTLPGLHGPGKNWNPWPFTECPPSLAPNQVVSVMDKGGISRRRLAGKADWSRVTYYLELQDPEGVVFCSPKGLALNTRYVAADKDGHVH